LVADMLSPDHDFGRGWPQPELTSIRFAVQPGNS
jgi:hypothetical protein